MINGVISVSYGLFPAINTTLPYSPRHRPNASPVPVKSGGKSSGRITPLIIMSELQEFDYKSATSIALVMLVASFLILFLMNLMQARNSKRLRGGNA